MVKSKSLILALSLAGSLIAPITASAHYYSGKAFFEGEWRTDLYQYFGGCENDDKTECLDSENTSWRDNTFFNIGELNVKQCVYQVAGPGVDDHGKFVFKYSYRFFTEEAADSTADKGIIKIKDIANNQLYYYREIFPAAATDDWTSVRVVLPTEALTKQLQMVFEVVNDSARVSRMHIDAVSADYFSKPQITGTVEHEQAGQDEVVSGATVKLMNISKTRTYATTTTNENGNFTFFPVKRNTKYRVVIEVNGETVATKKIPELSRGEWYQTKLSY